MGSDQGLRVSRRTLRCVTTIKIAPGTTEVGYVDPHAMASRLPNLNKLELDLRDELMWLYSRIPNITRNEILVKEIDGRLGTMFGVDVSSLRRWWGWWKIVVHAQFMRPADPEDLVDPDESYSQVLNVVGLLLFLLSHPLLMYLSDLYFRPSSLASDLHRLHIAWASKERHA
jgi:hypothetical protein